MSVKATVTMLKQIQLDDFAVPNAVEVHDSEEIIVLKDLSWEILNQLCDRFRATVFELAGKPDSKGGL
jgi:hypothetical protein